MAQMQVTSKVVVVRSGLAAVGMGLRMAAEMARQGDRVSLCLLQDGVLCARGGQQTPAAHALAEALDAGVEYCYLAEDLVARGFSQEDLVPGGRAIDYAELAKLLLADGTTAIGAF